MEQGCRDVGALQMSFQMVPRLPLRGGRGPRDPGLTGGGCSAPGRCQHMCAEEEV